MQELVFETAFSFYMHSSTCEYIYHMTWLPITVVAHKFAHQKYSVNHFLCSLFSVQILIYYVWRFLYGSMFGRHTHTRTPTISSWYIFIEYFIQFLARFSVCTLPKQQTTTTTATIESSITKTFDATAEKKYIFHIFCGHLECDWNGFVCNL